MIEIGIRDSIFSEFKLSRKEENIGALIWFRYNQHSIFNNELYKYAKKNYSDKNELEKVIWIVVSLYSFKDTRLFTGLLEKSFFEFILKITNQLRSLMNTPQKNFLEVQEKFDLIETMFEDEFVRDTIKNFVKFKWAFQNILEPYLESKDLSAYSTFIRICDASISRYLSSNVTVLMKIGEKIDFWDSKLTKFNIFFFGNKESFISDPTLYSNLTKHLFLYLKKLEFLNIDERLIMPNLSCNEEKEKLASYIELLTILSQKNSEIFTEIFLSNPSFCKTAFCMMALEDAHDFSIQYFIETIFSLENLASHPKSGKVMAESLRYFAGNLNYKLNMKMVKLIEILLKSGFSKEVSETFDLEGLFKSLKNILDEDTPSTRDLSTIATTLIELISSFRFLSQSHTFETLLLQLIFACEGNQGLLWCQLGSLAKVISRTTQGGNFLGRVADRCSAVHIAPPRWLNVAT